MDPRTVKEKKAAYGTRLSGLTVVAHLEEKL